MNHKTSTRRRIAALASGAMLTGGLVAAPALAGLSAANAAPVDLGYTCTIVGGGFSVPQDSTVTIDVTVPASVAPGAAAPATVVATIDMGSTSFGPIQSLAGPFTIPITVGGTTTNFTLPSSSAPVSDLTYTGTATGDLTAPAAAGVAPITVGTIVGDLTSTPFNAKAPATCVPDAGQDQTVGSLNVAGGTDPEPAALAYTCTMAFGGATYPFASTLDIDVSTPDSVDAGEEFDASVDIALDMGSSSMGPITSLSGAVDVALTVGDTATVVTVPVSDGTPAALKFEGSADVSLVAPDELGAADVAVGDLTGNFTANPLGMATSIPCVPDAGQDMSVGGVTVDEASAPVAVPVTGKVAIKGTAKVGKKLTAVPAKAAGAKVSYQWLSNGKAVKGAKAKTMKLTKSLKGKKVSVRVTYTKDGFLDVVQTSKAVKVKKK